MRSAIDLRERFADKLRQAAAIKFATKALPNYESQVANAIIKELQRALKIALRRRIAKVGVPVNLLGKVLPELSGWGSANKKDLRQTTAGLIIHDSISGFIRDMTADWSLRTEVSDEMLPRLHREAMLLDVKCRLPPVKKERKKRASAKGLTLVERRAREVESRLANWKRKQALAKTKVSALKKKAAYYKRMGTV